MKSTVKSTEGGTHHEVAIGHMVGEQAGEGLEDLAHGAVADDDDALPLEALREIGGVHGVQLAGIGLEDLAELLHGRFHGARCPAPLCCEVLVETCVYQWVHIATPALGSPWCE